MLSPLWAVPACGTALGEEGNPADKILVQHEHVGLQFVMQAKRL